jgi:hypothetical protein
MLSGSLVQQLGPSEGEEPMERYRATNELNTIFSNHTWAANGILFFGIRPLIVLKYSGCKKKKSIKNYEEVKENGFI